MRAYTQGGYTIDKIDADAHSRVVYGKCRTAYLQHEGTVATRLVRAAGALGGIGLARAARSDHQLDPDSAATFSTYASRSGLDAGIAKVGVTVANALPSAEEYWKDAVALSPADGTRVGWLNGVAWLREGRVVRLLLNIGDDTKLGELPAALATTYGSPGTTARTVTTWTLPGGISARLDIGTATSLVVESSVALATPTGASVATARPAMAPTPASGAPTPTQGSSAAPPGVASCCAALDKSAATAANDTQRSNFTSLAVNCRANIPVPASVRKDQLRQAAASMGLPALPPECQ